MGERGVRNEDATAADIAEMRRLVAEASAAGALGFTTSRTIFHRSIDGQAVPGTYASAEELSELALGVVDGGGGVFQVIPSSSIGAMTNLGGERFSQDHEMDLLGSIAHRTGLNVTFTTVQSRDYPDAWRQVLAFAAEQNAQGAHLHPQVASRPIGLLSSLGGYHPFMRRRTYLDLVGLPTAERAAAMRNPEVRSRILADDDIAPAQAGSMENLYQALQLATPGMYVVDDTVTVDCEPGVESSIGALAAARGVTPLEYMYDFLCQGNGENVATLLGAGYVEGNLDALHDMLVDPHTVTGLADAGAHVKLICDGTAPTTQLTHWTRDRSRGATIPLEFLVEKQTRRNARLYGLTDRGTIEVGMRADLNVIDLDNLTVKRPVAVADLPAGGWRFLQPVTGYVATVVNGVQTRDASGDTGARPGRLLRRPA
jgi:N-acyl-D-aspartate/D-glutamate deacylase